MSATQDFLQYRGRNAVDRDGNKIGTIEEIYLDQQTDRPEWALVNTGLLAKSSFVPLAGATPQQDELRLAYEKAQVKDAPGVDPDGELTQDQEAALYSHYGLDYSEGHSDTGLPEGRSDVSGRDPARQGTSVVGDDVSGAETDRAMTRSEEELRVGAAQREVGRARLRKHIVTENVERTVPLEREELRVEREPITEANRGQATAGPELSEEEHEVVLSEEEAVVEKRVVPKERLRLDKDTVTEHQQVSQDVRREEIELVDGEGAPARGHDGERGTDEGIDRR